MFLPIVPLKILTVYGLAESDLGDRVTQVAENLNVQIQPDPLPLLNVFIRSETNIILFAMACPRS